MSNIRSKSVRDPRLKNRECSDNQKTTVASSEDNRQNKTYGYVPVPTQNGAGYAPKFIPVGPARNYAAKGAQNPQTRRNPRLVTQSSHSA